MSDAKQTIDDYTGRVVRRLPASERDRAKAELDAHLSDAAEAGELAEALTRLGPPEEAAASFAGSGAAPPSPVNRRFAAVAVDNLPLAGVTIALLAQGIARVTQEGVGFALAFPPFVSVKIGDACVSIAPVQCASNAYADAGALYSVGVPLALAWSILALGLLEAWTGTTPGKRLMRLRVVTETGLRVHPVTAIVRRLSLLLGPFAWVDWAPVAWGDRRRLLDRLTETKVVSATAPATRRE
ncbi:RDD family protein [Nonomuraea sp. ATR24]|uniref:RDD family protein n=1 Tax=Nonomuraea sp. ATR24 TaxID=1676744 RepID=UPI0035C1F2A9